MNIITGQQQLRDFRIFFHFQNSWHAAEGAGCPSLPDGEYAEKCPQQLRSKLTPVQVFHVTMPAGEAPVSRGSWVWAQTQPWGHAMAWAAEQHPQGAPVAFRISYPNMFATWACFLRVAQIISPSFFSNERGSLRQGEVGGIRAENALEAFWAAPLTMQSCPAGVQEGSFPRFHTDNTLLSSSFAFCG